MVILLIFQMMMQRFCGVIMSKYNIPVDILSLLANRIGEAFWLKAFGIFDKCIGKMPEIKMNKRLTSTGGRAFFEQGYIDLSCYLMERNPEYYEHNTIPHELCHIIAWRLYGDTGHGKGWKYVMQEMGVNGTRCHTMQTKYQAEKHA